VTTDEDTAVGVTLTGHDVDGDHLVFTPTVPAHGSLRGLSPHFTYTPHLDYVGPDKFEFAASDGITDSPPATVTISVGPTIIPCGSLTPGTITAPGQVDRYLFAGQAGQVVSLALASTGGFSSNYSTLTGAELSLIAPSGTVLGILRSNSQGNFTLRATGIHIIRVRASNLSTTGSYNVNLECISPPGANAVLLPCGTRASGTIEAAAQVDTYSFVGQANQVVSLALASTGGFSSNYSTLAGAELSLIAASGTVLGILRSNSQGNFTLRESGVHIVRVSATNLATRGSYNVNLECISPPGANAVPLPCGTRASGTIEAAAQVDTYSFVGQANQVVSLALASTGGFSSNYSTLAGAELSLIAPSSTMLGILRSNSQGNFTLRESGVHIVRVSATNLATRGSYNVNLECLLPLPFVVRLQELARLPGTGVHDRP
jgi:hypothetical protein